MSKTVKFVTPRLTVKAPYQGWRDHVKNIKSIKTKKMEWETQTDNKTII